MHPSTCYAKPAGHELRPGFSNYSEPNSHPWGRFSDRCIIGSNSLPQLHSRKAKNASIVDLKSTARATVPMGTEAVATLIIPRRKKQQMTDASAMTTNQDDTNRSRREICGTPGLVLPERNHGQGSQGDQRPNWLQQRFNVTRKQTCQPFANVARFCESEQTRFFPLRLNLYRPGCQNDRLNNATEVAMAGRAQDWLPKSVQR